MAHVMLPGEFLRAGSIVKTQCAKDAQEGTIRVMSNLEAMGARVHVRRTRGGNVLGDGRDSPGPDIVQFLTEILGGRDVTPVAMEVDNTLRRSCALHMACGLGSADKEGRRPLKEVI